MIDIVNGIGRFINDTTKSIMGMQNRQTIQGVQIPRSTPSCTNCGNSNGIPLNQNGMVVFNTEQQVSSPNRRQAGQSIPEPNLRNIPYTNNTGLKFN